MGDWSKAGNSDAIFDVSSILLGIIVIAGAYFLQRGFKNQVFSSLLVLTGFGILGQGVVAENVFLPVHIVFGLFAFVFWTASAVISYKFEKSPLSYVSVILGAIDLVAIAFGLFGFQFGLGGGVAECLMVYPLLLWLLGFGAYLTGDSNDSATTNKHRIGHKLHSFKHVWSPRPP